ncbi:hypothetical protein HIM_03341 [Hirsutella minnesotensis 3608]|uniref:Sulfotransferase domain-containing protein n=1 Tax=Hirsutella minnesotensis 3608 TaxID=1043627 RepID=A0A0F7ZQC7_9HYPO|nr:hypothetical protein HIM_03341 [Hirsutella minnesotensis 3608]
MVQPPVFVLTHPRACSTAFERVFMTRRDTLSSQHEPFGDAYYFGPELLSDRFRDDVVARKANPGSHHTYKSILEDFEQVENQGKRVFVKDMAYYFFPPDGSQPNIAPSFGGGKEPGNPTVMPLEVLKRFHFAFLIRHPRRSIPSYYRCTIPPLLEKTGFAPFMPCEAGYKELAQLFDFLVRENVVDLNRVTVIDADDLLDSPEQTIRLFCERTGLDFSPEMLVWTQADGEYAAKLFAKWDGWHDDVLHSTRLNGRSHAQKTITVEAENQEWKEKYGAEAQRLIRETVDANIPHYEYLKKFCIRA